ncbi:Ankyrin repeat-containing protein [Quillaja saponaria]|uniref:Ankyrin repeat-containing protein n=1 Tax=Quillaja saponaria TaxID=32244 RepID=A0AAD7M5W3_QUISA|nr:Ankyrin repeat-containing protein [Quillaja saponaria]
MTTGNVSLSTISPLHHSVLQIQTVTSAQSQNPSLHLLDNTREAREKYLTLCVPLYKAALRGDWKTARSIFSEDKTTLNASITKGWETVLHVAAGANRVHFVEELVKLIDENDLALKDYKKNTAFCFAAAVGNVEITEIMSQKNPCLPTIRGGAGVTPLYMSILQGQREMALYLYPKTIEVLEEGDWNMLFFTCIKTRLYDLAFKMFEDNYSYLGLARDDNNETGLHVLARKLTRQNNWMQDHHHHALQLVRHLWYYILCQGDSDFIAVISKPSHLLFTAAEVGNVEFLAELLSSCPDLIWEVDDKNRTIIHVAVLHRHAGIFNLIHELGSIKEIIVAFVDHDEKNNLLHLAAKLAPIDQLNLVSGAALQMQLELLWFEEVKKIMLPSFIDMKNSKGITPRELFTIEHKELLSNAESWMKNTANSCMVVSTLITTGVFSAAFSIPGGSNDKDGTPNYLQNPVFLLFAVSDAMALISSSTSILMFLSILISRYAEDDFFKSLPMKLMIGLVALFISITSMMVAFSSAFFITYYHGLKWVPDFIGVLAFVPVPLFFVLQYPLWTDIIYSTYHCRSLFRPNKYMLEY